MDPDELLVAPVGGRSQIRLAIGLQPVDEVLTEGDARRFDVVIVFDAFARRPIASSVRGLSWR